MTALAAETRRISDSLHDVVANPAGADDRTVSANLHKLVEAEMELVDRTLHAIRSGDHTASVEELGLNRRKCIDSALSLCTELMDSRPGLSAEIDRLQQRLSSKREWMERHWPWLNRSEIAVAEAELDRGEGIAIRGIIDELHAAGRAER